MSNIDIKRIEDRFKTYLDTVFGVTANSASAVQISDALIKAISAEVRGLWESSREKHLSVRHAYYFSAEYLTGRILPANLLALGITDKIEQLLSSYGRSLSELDSLADPGLGNGGLGRLAACFLESAATMSLPLDGYGIKYNFGLFRQKFENGYQSEQIDDWQKDGENWLVKREDEEVCVDFGNIRFRAVPYDMPVIGFDSDNVGTLRLFECRPALMFDYRAFCEQNYTEASAKKVLADDICRILYPTDDRNEGKKLRLRQEFFLASASLKDIIRKYKRRHPEDISFRDFPNINVIQLNDTHPVIAIPELINQLCAEGLSFDGAFEVASRTFCYTNHTLMNEALEKWDMSLIRDTVPVICDIIVKIDAKLKDVFKAVPESCRIIDGNYVNMAHLAVFMSTYVNGVAELHSELLKTTLFSEWNAHFPDKIKNVTNGVSGRRFLLLANPELSSLIKDLMGSEKYQTDLSSLVELKKYSSDENVLRRLSDIKRKKHDDLAKYALCREGISISPDTMFDVQIKRLHEYKRQLLNILSIIELYYEIKEGSLRDFNPTTFIFGAKAAPGYYRAKIIIKLINSVSELLKKDSSVSSLISVVFVSNYDVSYAERIIAAADISEQISTAGTEASGTGNMKMMLNGAVTLGTYDGANIEIFRAAGNGNNYVFGADIEDIKKTAASYDPKKLYNGNEKIRRAVNALTNGLLGEGEHGIFEDLKSSLLLSSHWQEADRYRVLYDFESYLDAKKKVNRDFKNTIAFAEKSLMNIAGAGQFSSDRSIDDYSNNIWHISKL